MSSAFRWRSARDHVHLLPHQERAQLGRGAVGEIAVGDAELRRAHVSAERAQGEEDEDEDGGDDHPVRPRDAVVDQGVEKHRDHEREVHGERPAPLLPQGEGDGKGRGQDEDEDTRGVRSALRLYARAEDEGHDDVDHEQDEHERSCVRGPGGRHAEAREVARQEVEEARHGRGTR
jgi:hypothetical protein